MTRHNTQTAIPLSSIVACEFGRCVYGLNHPLRSIPIENKIDINRNRMVVKLMLLIKGRLYKLIFPCDIYLILGCQFRHENLC